MGERGAGDEGVVSVELGTDEEGGGRRLEAGWMW